MKQTKLANNGPKGYPSFGALCGMGNRFKEHQTPRICRKQANLEIHRENFEKMKVDETKKLSLMGKIIGKQNNATHGPNQGLFFQSANYDFGS